MIIVKRTNGEFDTMFGWSRGCGASIGDGGTDYARWAAFGAGPLPGSKFVRAYSTPVWERRGKGSIFTGRTTYVEVG